jgi:F0F1-type ATP synthase assembly protein I
MLALMEGAPRQTFQPAGAGALLASVALLGIGAGALVGWAAGAAGYGVLVGALVGVPAGILAVYRRYRGVL